MEIALWAVSPAGEIASGKLGRWPASLQQHITVERLATKAIV
jgi:hypothetical protein